MKPKYKYIVASLLVVVFCFCSNGKDEDANDRAEPALMSSYPVSDVAVPYSIEEVFFVFEQDIVVVNPVKITIDNDAFIAEIQPSGNKLLLKVENIKASTTYRVTIGANAIKAEPGLVNTNDYFITFATRQKSEINSTLVAGNASPQAVRVYRFLLENYQLKTISSTMAKVSWNIEEAERVYRWTGKYPAMNCFDFIHHKESLPGGWINYDDCSVVEDWWQNNGLVSVIWHWNVPVAEGSPEYAFYFTGKGNGGSETSFDIANATQEGTYEHGVITADLEQIAGYLLLLKEKNIPVIWRPLHEASGKWFWWGAKDAESYKALWHLMFDTFESKGLNNLIWVWTTEVDDADWYPGDKYVDIIGRDMYNKPDVTDPANDYTAITGMFPEKMAALSECGNVARISTQWKAGITWSWFMPWYDYYATDNAHLHAAKDFWVDAFSSHKVITRDNMPELKITN